MNTPIVNDTFRLLKHLLDAHLSPGEAQGKLDQSMGIKNACVRLGRSAGLSDEELEEMTLAVLLHPLDELECGLSTLTAETLLTRWGLSTARLLRLIDCLEVLSQSAIPQNTAHTLLLRAARTVTRSGGHSGCRSVVPAAWLEQR